MRTLINRTPNWLLIGVLALIAIMPFHTFITTWAGTYYEIRPYLQAWKEVLLAILGLVTAGTMAYYPQLRLALLRSPLFWAILLYGILHIILVFAMRNPAFQELLALKYNLSFLAAFLVALVASYFVTSRSQLEAILIKLILATSIVVALFAVIQAILLPPDWLIRFGYGSETVAPFQPIQDSDTTRVISTLGGPNQLGSFLLLPFALSLYKGIASRRWKIYAPLLTLFTLALFFSHSRSAWIGAIAATAIILALTLKPPQLKRAGVITLATLVILTGTIYAALERSPALQTALLHSSYDKAFTASSNTDHLIAMTDGAQATLDNPLGAGPGSSGPASEGTPDHLITESYYFQISVEVGLIGLALFLSIMYLVSKHLYAVKHSSLAVPLLASFWGIAFFNFLLHGWTDSSTALVWWCTAGLVCAPAVLSSFKKDRKLLPY